MTPKPQLAALLHDIVMNRENDSIAIFAHTKSALRAEIESALADGEKLAKVKNEIEHHIAEHQSASQTIENILNATAS